MRIGIGYDSHKFTGKRKLIIGGVEIPHDKGLEGHSDADVLCHAIMDSIFGALGEGDIGKFFPDTDDKWKDASSISMLAQTVAIASRKGLRVSWLDSIIITEKPRLNNFIEKMKDRIRDAGISRESISIKAKTNEGMGFVGRGEGIVAQAVCILAPE